MSLQLADQELILMQEQTAQDSDPIDSALNNGNSLVAQEVNEVSIDPQAINDAPERMTWSKDGNRAPFVKNMAEIEIEAPLVRGVSGSDNQPYYHPLWKAMNFTEALGSPAGGSTTYSPSTPMVSWLCLYQFIRNAKDNQSRLRYITDVHLGGEITFSAGEESTISCSGVGYYTTITQPRDYISDSGDFLRDKDGTDISGTGATIGTVSDFEPLIPKNMKVELSGTNIGSNVTYDVSEVTIDLNLTQDQVDAVTNSPGHMPNYNTRGAGEAINVGFTLAEASAGEFDNLIADYEAADQMTLNLTLRDNGGNDRIDVNLPNVQLGVESPGENGNLRNHEFEGRANRDLASSKVGDNAIEVIYQ